MRKGDKAPYLFAISIILLAILGSLLGFSLQPALAWGIGIPLTILLLGFLVFRLVDRSPQESSAPKREPTDDDAPLR